MALAALAVAIIAVAVVLLGGSSNDYVVRARFQDASQLVRGNDVQVAGVRIGAVDDIQLTDDGRALVTMKIQRKGYTPLHEGTQAVVRLTSLSGVANRYVDLRLGGADGRAIPDGGELPTRDTTSAVDLDKLLDTLDAKTRTSLRDLIRGSGVEYDKRDQQLRRGWLYLNPSLAASSRFFDELTRDTPMFERFIVANSRLVTDLAERRGDVARLVDKLANTTGQIASERAALGDAVGQLPPVMRRANSTFVDLRSTLDTLRPTVEEFKPVAKRFRPFFHELRPLFRRTRVMNRNLALAIHAPGRDNDLVESQLTTPAVRDVALKPTTVDGQQRDGAFPEITKAFQGSTPQVAFARPYAVDLTGWFDDFGHSGIYDALGGISRVGTYVDAFGVLNGVLRPIAPPLRDQARSLFTAVGQRNRCPGAADHPAADGSSPWKPSPDFNCDPSQILPGK